MRPSVIPMPPEAWSTVLAEPVGECAMKVRLMGYRHYARVRSGRREHLVSAYIPSEPMDELVHARLADDEAKAVRLAWALVIELAWRAVSFN